MLIIARITFLLLGEGPTYGINGSFGSPEKKFSINFTKGKINRNEISKFKADNGSVNFPFPFCLGSISNGFGGTEYRDVSLKGNIYDFSVDYNAIDKSDILNI